jgi:hypothetical protein
LVLALAVLLSVSSHLRCGAEGEEASVGLAAKLAQARTTDELNRIADGYVSDRSRLVDDAIVLLRGNPEIEVTIRVAYLLGALRAEEAVQDLTKHIKLETKSLGTQEELRRWGRYPVKEALMKIGNRSIPCMVRLIGSSDDATERRHAVEVIWVVSGQGFDEEISGKEVACLILGKAIEKDADVARRKRLADALLVLRSK